MPARAGSWSGTKRRGGWCWRPAAVSVEDMAAASTSSLAGSGRTSTTASEPPSVTSSGSPAAPAAELDLGAVVLPSVARRYGPGVLAGLVAVLVVWLLRRRAR